MDIPKILAQLRSEREHIEKAIIALAKLRRRHRGRPPKWMTVLTQKKKPRVKKAESAQPPH